MGKTGKHGVSATTTQNILFGAGTIHKGLKYTTESVGTGSWNFDDSIIGATSGGSSLSITPEITNIEVDGALVKTKGFNVKTGEVATMDINLLEITQDIIKAATIGKNGTSPDAANYSLIESKADIEVGDYWDNIAFVGKTLDGRNIIAILDNALCTSGLKTEGKNKEGAVGAYTFECNADLTGSPNLDTLPWHIYYPADPVT